MSTSLIKQSPVILLVMPVFSNNSTFLVTSPKSSIQSCSVDYYMVEIGLQRFNIAFRVNAVLLVEGGRINRKVQFSVQAKMFYFSNQSSMTVLLEYIQNHMTFSFRYYC